MKEGGGKMTISIGLLAVANNASCINGGSVTEDMPIKHEVWRS